MNFTTMVADFKRRVLKEEKEELEELTGAAREKVKRYITKGTPGRHTPRYSFNHIFGDETTMRVIIPLEGEIRIKGTELFKRIIDQGWKPAFTNKVVKQKLQRRVGELPAGFGTPDPETNPDPRPVEDYEEDKEVPVLTMTKEEVRTIPKGPRAGEKITSTKKASLGKLIGRIGTPEDKQWWAEHQNSLNEMQNVQDYFLKPWMNDFKGVGETRPIVVISRHPIDVARMSDFSMTHSCHSEGASHFGCALAESKGHGMVAFLVRGEDAEKITKYVNDGEDEIFGDSDYRRFDDNPEPAGRVRLRKLFNSDTGEEFATVEDRVYGVNVPDFLPTVRKWARDTQEDMWKGKDGKMKHDFVNDADWALLGGDYLDTEVVNQLETMFADTEWEEAAEEIFANMDFEYDDLYNEEEDNDEQEATDRLETMERRANERVSHGAFRMDIEEGWDDMPWYPTANYVVEFEMEIDPDQSDRIPDFRDYFARRKFEQGVVDVLEDFDFSEYEGWTVEFSRHYRPGQLEISVYGEARLEQRGLDALEDIEYFVEEVFRNYEEKYRSIKARLRAFLIDEGYAKPGTYEKAVEDWEETEYENITVLYDEDDPGDGIDIFMKPDYAKPDLWRKKTSGRYLRPHHKVIASFPLGPAYSITRSVLTRFLQNYDQDATKMRIQLAFEKLIRQAEKRAARQTELPFGSEYKRPPITVPKSSQISILNLGAPTPSQPSGPAVDFGLQFIIKILPGIAAEEYETIRIFLGYLDKNIGVFEEAAKQILMKDFEKARVPILSRDAAPEADPEADPEAPEAPEWRPGMPTPIAEAKLKEQVGFETPLYQVTLQLRLDPTAGGGIEQKLNRIRAIQGVTVVGHSESKEGTGINVIECRIKFHPESNAMRPGTYITRILVPSIDISHHVPGVSVIRVIKGTLKRLDK